MKRFLLCLLGIIVIYIGFKVMGPRTPVSLEGQVIQEMETITKVELLHSLTKGRGQFADLATLGQEGLVDPDVAAGEKYGYLFTLKVEAITGRRAMYEVSATPKNGNEPRTGSHSFYTNETLGSRIYKLEGMEPPKATTEVRVPKVGLPVRNEPLD